VPVRRVRSELGFKHVYVVPEQENPDPKFTTLDYPNPEDPKAFTYALNLAKEKDADIVLATDPDADRLGVYAKDNKTGEYVAFLDGDDWLELDCFEKTYKKAKEGNYDIVAYDTLAIYPDKNMYISSNIDDEQDNKKLMIDAYAVVCNKLFKRTLLKGIKFKEKIALAEDVLFLYQVYPRANKIGVVKEPFLNYLQRQGSATYVYDKKIYDLIKVMDIICDDYKNKKIINEYKEEIEYTYVRYLYATFIKRLAKTKNKEEFKKGVEFVLEKVKSTFPNYRKNKYIRALNGKSLYLRFFNRFISKLIFMLEKNKMN